MSSKKQISKQIKGILDTVIDTLSPVDYAKRPWIDFTRKRKLDFHTLMEYLIGRNGGSLLSSVRDFFSWEDQMSPSAVIQQEDKLAPGIMEKLLYTFNMLCDKLGLDDETMKGHHIYAVDGTDVNVAYDKDADTYVKQTKNGEPTKGYNRTHLSVIHDVLNHLYVQAYVAPECVKGEREAMLDMVKGYDFPKGSILVMDRGYAGLCVFEALNRTPNVDFLIRIPDNFIKELSAMPKCEEWDIERYIHVTTRATKENKELRDQGKLHILRGISRYGHEKKKIDWCFEDDAYVHVRFTHLKVENDEDGIVFETFATSLPPVQFPPERLKELYRMRWNVETSFRDLKYDLGLSHLHSRREDFVEHEIFSKMLAYNFSMRVIMNVAAKKSERERKHEYEISHKDAIAICMYIFKRFGLPPPDLESEVSSHIVPVRPGRKDKRNKKKQKIFISFMYRVA